MVAVSVSMRLRIGIRLKLAERLMFGSECRLLHLGFDLGLWALT